MKKKIAPKKATTKKTVKRTSPRSTRSANDGQTLLFRRIVIISACLILVVGVVATFNRGATRQAVAGMSIMAGLYDQATIQLPTVPNAASYNIYYGPSGEATFSNAVRNIPPNVSNYTISDLKKGVTYNYMYAAVDKNGREFLFSPI
ncbi:MAG TPA: hypothetical protein VLF93_08055, partial [Candidatus Saccharimonadales bacterium]|nr:hypothetical protein [Candidatus Saccharimonadales bacterium]